MARPLARAVAILLIAGSILCLAGAAAAAVGLINPNLISDRLPPEAIIDAAAVGGAAVALGVATGLLGLAHLATALALRRGIGLAMTGGVVLTASMAVLSFAFGVAALVSAASDSAPAVVMLPAALGLAGGAIGYAMAAILIIGSQRRQV
jgi:hypothetical protein